MRHLLQSAPAGTRTEERDQSRDESRHANAEKADKERGCTDHRRQEQRPNRTARVTDAVRERKAT